MKLEVGMYVRTDDGYIFKITELLEKGKYHDSGNKIVQSFRIDGMYKRNDDYIATNYMYSDWIIKASKKKIDLIEVGDYVNCYRVADIKDNNKFKILIMDIGDTQEHILYDCFIEDGSFLEIREEQIQLIATKEQFKNINYELGDE